MFLRNLLQYFKNQALRPRLFYFNVILSTAIFYIAVEFQHENNTYYNIINSADRFCTNETDTGKIKSIVMHVYEMMRDRHKIFRNKEQLSWKQYFFKSVDVDLMYGAGSCGGYSKVLTRSLNLAGFKVRIGQLKVHGYYGGHILMEVYSNEFHKWILVDPLYGIMVTDSTGYPLAFVEAKQQWEDVKHRFPLAYQKAYRYKGIRYTNWDKYGWASRLAKAILTPIIGKDNIEYFSMRPLLLSTYKVYLLFFIILFLIYHSFSFYSFSKKQKTVITP